MSSVYVCVGVVRAGKYRSDRQHGDFNTSYGDVQWQAQSSEAHNC